jgi:hypothetical protein
VDGACGVGYIDSNITDLPEAVGTLIEPEKLRDHRGSVGEELSRGDMGRKRRAGLFVFEERAE